MSSETTDQWVIVEPCVIVLPTTGYEIRYEGGRFVAYHNGKRIAHGGAHTLEFAKTTVSLHMRDLMAVGIES